MLRNAVASLLLAGLSARSGLAQVGGPPVITVQPLDQAVLNGGTAVFSVVAISGTTMSYQWRHNGTNLAGATSSAHTIPSVRPADAGNYSVRIVNAGGAVASSNANLTVLSQTTSAVGPTGDFACVSATNVATRSWLHSVSGGQNRILVVGIAVAENSETVTSVTYGGAALTRMAAIKDGNTAELWYLLAPRIGSAEIMATWTGNRDMAGWSGTFTNVDQTNPIRAAAATNGNTATPNITLAAGAGDLVVDTLSANGDALTLLPAVGQLQICQNVTGTGGGDCWGASSYKPGAASVTMSWLAGTAKNWGIAAAALRAAPVLQADVATSVTGPGSVLAGGSLTYAILVTNAGSATASNLIVADLLPSDVTFLSASDGGTLSNGVVIWPAIQMPANSSITFNVTATAPGSGTLVNTVASSAATYDPDAANNNGGSTNAQAVTVVIPQGSPALAGPAALATVSATNVASRTWMHTVPAGSNRFLVVGIALADTGDSVSGMTYGGTALKRITSIQSGNTVELWQLLAPPVGTASLVATWTGNRDMAGWSGTFTNVDQTNPIRTSAVSSGNTATPTLTLAAAQGDLVVDTLSANGDADSLLVGPGQTQISQQRTGNAGGDCWGAASFKPGAESVTMSWLTAAAKNWGLAATVLRAAAPIQADVGVALTGAATVSMETNFTYAIRVANSGPQAASNLLVRDPLPPGVSFIGASGGGVHSNGVVTWTLPNLASSTLTNLTLTLRATALGLVTNSVIVNAGTSDPQPANNGGSFVTTVVWINSPPVAHDQSVSTMDSTARLISLTGSDADTDALTFALVTPPAHGILSGFNNTNGTLTYTPAAGYTGADSFTFRVQDGWTSSAPATVSITVVPVPPAIMQQPQSVAVSTGQTAIFSVAVSGTAPLGYQWHFNGIALAGATSAMLTLTNVQSGAAGDYSVTVANPGGSIVSDPASLTVLKATIVEPPALATPQMTADGFSFQFPVPAGATYVVRATTNLKHWTTIATNVAAADKEFFTDKSATNFGSRCYQVVVLQGAVVTGPPSP